MAKERSLKLNIVASMAIQVISLVVNLISKRAIRMYLGMEYLGMQSIFSNFCDVMNFAFLGTGTAMLFSMYGAFARDNEEEIASYYHYFDKLYRKITVMVLLGGILCTLLALYTVNANIEVMEICITYLTYMLSVVVSHSQLARYYFIEADQRRYVVAIVSGVVDASALVVEIFVLNFFHSYEGFLVCILLKNVLINFIYKKYLKRNYAYISKPCKELDRIEQGKIVTNAKDMILYRFGKVLISNTDSIFISRFTSTLVVGIYSNYQFVSYGISSIIGALFEAAKGKIGNRAQTKSLDIQYKDFKTYLCVNSWLMGFTMVCFYFLIEDFIYVWMGAVDTLSKGVLVILLINFYLEESQSVIRAYRETAGIFRKICTMILIKGIANIVLSFILGRVWGLMGVLIATTISSTATLFWYEPKTVYQYFKKSLWNEVLYHIVTVFLMAVSFGVTYLAVHNMEGAGIIFLLCKGVVCVIASNAVYMILFGVWYAIKGKNLEGRFF